MVLLISASDLRAAAPVIPAWTNSRSLILTAALCERIHRPYLPLALMAWRYWSAVPKALISSAFT